MIEIKPIHGYCRGKLILTPVDSVLWCDPGSRPREIGIAERFKGAPLILHAGAVVPAAVITAANKALAERDADDIKSPGLQDLAQADAGNRPAHYASAIEDDDEDDE